MSDEIKFPRVALPRPDRLYHSLRFRRRQSEVAPPTVEEILRAYDLELLTRPEVPPGPGRSYSLIVSTPGGKKLLKRYKHTVPVGTVVHEHSILTYLNQVGFSSPCLVATPAGETLVCRDGHNYALFDFIEGGFQYHNYLWLPAQLGRFIATSAEILAALHAKLRDFVPLGYNYNGFTSREGDWWRDLEWHASRLDRCIEETRRMRASADGTRAAWLLERADDLQDTLHRLDTRLKQAALPRLIIHGDYGPYNLLFRRNAPVVVLDFEIARLDWRATELVDALYRFCYTRLGFSLDKIKCFLDAYRAHFALDPGELELVPAVWEFLNVRRCIVRWHHYCETQESRRLVQARWNLQLIDWIRENRDDFLVRLGAAMAS